MKIGFFSVLLMLGLNNFCSAQSVSKMQIAVRVNSGATIFYEDNYEVNYSGFGQSAPTLFYTEKEVEFRTNPNHEYVILEPAVTELQNEYGEFLMIQSSITALDDPEPGKLRIHINSAVDFQQIPRGTFKGNYAASIEYL